MPDAATSVLLDVRERRVAMARIRVGEFVERLLATPIDRELYAELREFLDQEAVQACAAWEELRARGPRYQQRRLLALLRLSGVHR